MKKKLLKAHITFSIIFILLVSWGCNVTSSLNDDFITTSTSSASRNLDGKLIVGYMPYWQGDINAVQYDKLTHVMYAFLLANSDGTVDYNSVNTSRLTQVVSLAHSHGTKVFISLGGWGNGPALTAAMNNSSTRNALVNNCIKFVNEYNLDGFDLDWEGPANASEGEAWADFMQKMNAAMHTKGKQVASAIAMWYGNNIPSSALAYMDFANIMAYDNSGTDHSSYEYSVQNVNYWNGRGIPLSKCILGVPFYGYDSNRTAYTFAQIVAMNSDAQNQDYYNGIGYNGIPTIKKKALYVQDYGLGGIMMWELSQDATGSASLLSAMYNILANNTVGNYQITASAGSNGSISPTGTINVSSGGSATFTFQANTNYAINQITIDGNTVSSDSSYTFTNVNENHAINVTFSYTGTGSECSTPIYNPSTVYYKGDIVHNNGHHWEAQWWTQGTEPGTTGDWGVWRDQGVCNDNGQNQDPTYTITASSGSNGIISSEGSSAYTEGDTVTYQFYPDNGYTISDVIVDRNSQGVLTSYSFNSITSNHTISVTFASEGSSTGGDTWVVDHNYAIGDIVTYNGQQYKCAYDHTSNSAWVPGTAGLWFWELI